jgi:hypothetical protein
MSDTNQNAANIQTRSHEKKPSAFKDMEFKSELPEESDEKDES